jgi:hypothetical protein
MSQERVAYRWTAADLDRLPDDPLLRYEIIDGELIVSRRPHLQHSEILVRLVSWLHPVAQAGGGKFWLNQESSGEKKPKTTSYPILPWSYPTVCILPMDLPSLAHRIW